MLYIAIIYNSIQLHVDMALHVFEPLNCNLLDYMKSSL